MPPPVVTPHSGGQRSLQAESPALVICLFIHGCYHSPSLSPFSMYQFQVLNYLLQFSSHLSVSSNPRQTQDGPHCTAWRKTATLGFPPRGSHCSDDLESVECFISSQQRPCNSHDRKEPPHPILHGESSHIGTVLVPAPASDISDSVACLKANSRIHSTASSNIIYGSVKQTPGANCVM